MSESREILPKDMLNSILKSGIVIVGGPATGKTNAGKVITSEIIRKHGDFIQVKAFDSAMNLRYEYEPILYQEINERTRYFYDGNEHIVFDINLLSERDFLSFVGKVILNDYINQRKAKERNCGIVQKWILYYLEESQSVLGTYSLMRREARTLLKLFSEGRNFGLSYTIVGQRLAEISTSAIERRMNFLFGRMTGDADISKLKRIVGRDSDIVEDVKKLEIEKGQFIFWNGFATYDFNSPKWEPLDKNANCPIPWEPKVRDVPIWRYRDGARLW